jgi:BioD-like phosphotransacetylase family protein
MNLSDTLSQIASSLQSAQGQVPQTDTASVAALQQAYALISQVQLAYQGQ